MNTNDYSQSDMEQNGRKKEEILTELRETIQEMINGTLEIYEGHLKFLESLAKKEEE